MDLRHSPAAHHLMASERALQLAAGAGLQNAAELQQLMGHPEPWFRTQAIAALKHFGDAALPLLHSAKDDAHPQVQTAMVKRLVTLATPGALQALQALTTRAALRPIILTRLTDVACTDLFGFLARALLAHPAYAWDTQFLLRILQRLPPNAPWLATLMRRMADDGLSPGEHGAIFRLAHASKPPSTIFSTLATCRHWQSRQATARRLHCGLGAHGEGRALLADDPDARVAAAAVST